MSSLNIDPQQTSLVTGEISPIAYGRNDLARYANAVKKLDNFIITPHGGLFKRMGTQFVSTTKDQSKLAVLIPFRFQNIQAYVIEAGNQYMRFYKDNAQITSSGSPVEISTPYLEADLDEIYPVQTIDSLYLFHKSYATRKLTRTSDTAWTLTEVAWNDGPYLDKNETSTTLTLASFASSTTVTASAPLFSADHVGCLFRIEEAAGTKYHAWRAGATFQNGQMIVSNNKVYSVDISGSNADDVPLKLGSITEWRNAVAYPQGFYVYWGENVFYSVTAGTSGTIPPVTSGSDGSMNWNLWGKRCGTIAPNHDSGTESDGNVNFTYLHGGYGVIKITAVASSTSATATLISRPPNSALSGTTRWREGVWSKLRGYPSCGQIWQGRLWAGKDARLYGSVTGDYENHEPSGAGGAVTDTNAINVIIENPSIGAVDEIRWLSAGEVLVAGTSGGEFTVKPASTSSPISPSNIAILPQTRIGSEKVMPVKIGSSVVFVNNTINKVFELIYNFQIDGFESRQLSIMSEHMPRENGGIIASAYQQDPWGVVWFLCNNGTLLACTYLREEQITGWSRCVIGGSFANGNAVVESIATIPSVNQDSDQLWLIVKRTVNGSTKRYVETLSNQFFGQTPDDFSGMVYLDSAKLYSGSAVTSITGLSHLEGQSVGVVVNGYEHPDQTVASASIPVSDDIGVTSAVVGLKYDAVVKTLNQVFTIQGSSTAGNKSRIWKFVSQFFNSLDFEFSSDDIKFYAVSFRSTSDIMDERTPLFTGFKDDYFISGYAPEQSLIMKSNKPYPLNILSMTMKMEVAGEA
jgi:hypothetical protein